MRAMIRCCWLAALAAPCLAFDGHRVEEGPLRLTIEAFESPRAAEVPVAVPVVLENHGPQPVECALRVHGLVDEWHAAGPAEATLAVAPGGAARHAFRIAAAAGVERALYPVHVTALPAPGRGPELHAVRIFEAAVEPAAATAASAAGPLAVPPGGCLSLLPPAHSRVVWERFDQPGGGRPPGWTGSDPETGASRDVHDADRGGVRRALVMHPPWRAGAGAVRAVYQVRLPEALPLVLEFANAVRDPDPGGRADGVTFRVRVGDELAFDRHTDSHTWVEGRVDLARWAGRTVDLALESDPGPRRDTAFDSSFWAGPVIRSGPPPRVADAQQAAACLARAAGLLDGAAPAAADVVLDLGGGARAALAAGPNGWLDGALGFAVDGRRLCLQGFEVAVDGSLLARPDSACRVERAAAEPLAGGGVVMRHACVDARGAFELRLEARPDRGALRLRVAAPRLVTRFAPGPADQPAARVYAGHGYVIEEPGRFTLDFGGHGLATSHVAADFAGGLALLTASDHPPVAFEVDPARRRYSLVTRYDATLTLLPGARGGLEAAVRYRPLYDKPAAAGVAAKAGRFVFDLWGGRYAELAETMQGAIDHGLADSMLTVHVWQRWGYDYRLPDIHPPDPRLGAAGDLRELSRLCRAHRIPWGLHDNYIDFYPDADGYSYRHVCFDAAGEPVRAWLNEGRGAQSYRWRPDAFQPFLRRNLGLIGPDLAPSHSFVDVFTSIPPVEFHDRDGAFHDALETRRLWGEAFDTIRAALQPPAITCSEAGHDQLTGHLDGADCQFLELAPAGRPFTIAVPCRDWERIPWFDAVLHDRFILHGVGYSSRYEGGRGRHRHGIDSDDYLSAEILTGHALMTDRGSGLAGAVRKYWLAQPVARALALGTITAAGWDEGNLHRLRVDWQRGMKVRVNRGPDDWQVDGRVLPAFGFVAADATVGAAVERIDGRVVERSHWPGGFYVNSRTAARPGDPLPVTPAAGPFTALDAGRFRLPVRWAAAAPLPREATVFLHVLGTEAGDREGIVAQGDHRPEVPTTRWNGELVTGAERTVELPPNLPDGRYPVVAGLFAPGGERFPLTGIDAGGNRCLLGTLVLAAGAPPAFEPAAFTPPPPATNPPGTMVDFGPAATDGAFRLASAAGGAVLTPLPGSPAMRVVLRPSATLPAARVARVTALIPDGAAGEPVPHQLAAGELSFSTRPGDFAYQLTLGPGQAR